jgi:hypothetical protein
LQSGLFGFRRVLHLHGNLEPGRFRWRHHHAVG